VVSSVLKLLTDFIAPAFCGFCHRILSDRDPLCNTCLGLIKLIPSNMLPLAQGSKIPVYSLGTLEDPLRYLVNSRNPAHCICLGTLLWRFSVMLQLEFDVLIPLQNSPQNRAIALQLGVLSGKPVIEEKSWFSVPRKGHTLLTHKQMKYLSNKRIVIVVPIFFDNLLVWECAQHLLQADPASLSVLVICRPARR
jgi:hypothetical protein